MARAGPPPWRWGEVMREVECEERKEQERKKRKGKREAGRKKGKRGVKKIGQGTSPGGQAVKTPHFHCEACGFHPWLRNRDPICLGSLGMAKELKKDRPRWDIKGKLGKARERGGVLR